MIDTYSNLATTKQTRQEPAPLPGLAEGCVGSNTVILQLLPAVKLSHDQFFDLCQLNQNLRLEQTAGGEMLVIMLPAGGETGNRNLNLATDLNIWARKNKQGVGFDSSTGFILPNGATRSPDVAWVRRERLAGLTIAEKQKFLPLCPDFVVELRSPSDRLRTIQAKVQEYIDNGAMLGWLIDPVERKVHCYRPDTAPLVLDNPATVSGDPELPGFVLELGEIWEPGF